MVDEKLSFGLGILANTLCAAAVGLGLYERGAEEEMRVLRWLNDGLKSARVCEFGEIRTRALRVDDSIEFSFFFPFLFSRCFLIQSKGWKKKRENEEYL